MVSHLNLPFQHHSDLVRRSVQQERLALWGLGVFSALTLLVPIAIKGRVELPKPIIAISLGLSAVAAGVGGAIAYASAQKQTIYQGFQQVQHTFVKDALEQQAAAALANQEFAYKWQLFQRMMAELPPALWNAYIHEHYLEQFRPVAEQYLQQLMPAVDTVATPVQSATITLSAGDAIADLTARENAIDYSWIDDPKFVRASKAVFAPKGSGKSFLISYLAAKFVEQNPDGVLWIIDPHFNQHSAEYSNEPDDMETVWLNGIPKAELYCADGKLKRRSLVKDPDSAYRTFKEFAKILRDRVQRGAKKEYPIHIICDEFENRLRQWSEDQAAEVLEVIAECEDEWRKYGGGVTVSMHSIKKGNTGIDSSIVFQMHLLALGGALADTTVKWPSDLDASRMAVARNELNESLNNRTEGYAAVLRKLNSSPQLVVIPPIDPYAFNFAISETVGTQTVSIPAEPARTNGGGGEYWLDNLEAQLPEKPTPDQVKSAYEAVMGDAVNEERLPYLLKLLQDRGWVISNE